MTSKNPPDGAPQKQVFWHQGELTTDERRAAYGHSGAVVWLTGLSGAGKSSIAHRVERRLVERGVFACVLDGDNVRYGLCADLGFSPADRAENIRRVGQVSRLLDAAGAVVLAAFVSPYRADRDRVRALLPAGHFVETHVATALAVCERRDPKGLYARARRGELKGLTGIDAPYEAPEAPELLLDADALDLDACVERVLQCLVERNVLPAGFQRTSP